ncbi:MAG: AAA family ATPase [Mobilitalea sp.]
MREKNLIYGLDDKVDKIKNYCIKFLKNDKDFEVAKKKLSITPTFLFDGLPGTGKTTIAHEVYEQLKEEYNIDLICLRIDELISQNFGESSKNLIAFFEQIKKDVKDNSSFAFVIIDELDSFTVNRYQNDNESIKRVLLTFNTIIDEMFLNGDLDKIILIATTNIKESIDTSVLRRFFFHEDFNISLNKDEFCCFIDEIRAVSSTFDTFHNDDIEKLFEIYEKKKFTLGELKTIFAHFYMESKTELSNETLNFNVFIDKESFYETIVKQRT